MQEWHLQAQIQALRGVLRVYPDAWIQINTHTYVQTHIHTHCKSKVLGSRLSRPGSPLAALSQLRSTDRVGWEGWVMEVERVAGRVGGGEDGEIFQRTSVTVSNLWAAFFQPSLWPTDSLAWLIKNYESFRGGLSPCTRPGKPHTYRLSKTHREDIIINLLCIWTFIFVSLRRAGRSVQVMWKLLTDSVQNRKHNRKMWQLSALSHVTNHIIKMPYDTSVAVLWPCVYIWGCRWCWIEGCTSQSACMRTFLPLPQVFKLYSKQ